MAYNTCEILTQAACFFLIQYKLQNSLVPRLFFFIHLPFYRSLHKPCLKFLLRLGSLIILRKFRNAIIQGHIARNFRSVKNLYIERAPELWVMSAPLRSKFICFILYSYLFFSKLNWIFTYFPTYICFQHPCIRYQISY